MLSWNYVMRICVTSIGFLFAFFMTSLFTSVVSAAKPNIVYILLDDVGYGDVGCYGQIKFDTPNIDRLASEGMRFTQHYSGKRGARIGNWKAVQLDVACWPHLIA